MIESTNRGRTGQLDTRHSLLHRTYQLVTTHKQSTHSVDGSPSSSFTCHTPCAGGGPNVGIVTRRTRFAWKRWVHIVVLTLGAIHTCHRSGFCVLTWRTASAHSVRCSTLGQLCLLGMPCTLSRRWYIVPSLHSVHSVDASSSKSASLPFKTRRLQRVSTCLYPCTRRCGIGI